MPDKNTNQTNSSNLASKKVNGIKFVFPKNIVRPVVITLIVCAVLGGAYFIYDNFLNKDTITVTGSATTQVVNKIASFSVTIEYNDEDKSTAVDNVSGASNDLVLKIKGLNIDEKDIQTTGLNVYRREDPVYDSGVTKYEPGNWYASYTINITLRDLDKSDDLVSVLTKAENSTMWGPNYTLDYDQLDPDLLLAEAIENARTKAEKLAASTGRKVGKVIHVTEGSSGYNEIYAVKDMSMGAGGSGFSMEPGSSQTSRSVTVTFRLR